MFSSKEELEFACSGKTDGETAKQFGVHPRTIGYWRKKFNIPRQEPDNYAHRKYSINHHFFDNINSEDKAYFLGLICADGHITKTGKNVQLFLQSKDEHIIEQLKVSISSDAPIKTKVSTGGYKEGSTLKGVTLGSKKLVATLNELGLYHDKSHSLSIPTVPEPLQPHFIRGLWDGNGSITAKQVYYIGNNTVVDQVRSIIDAHTKVFLSKGTLRTGHPRLSGGFYAKPFLDWMYKDANIYLTRKHDKYSEHWCNNTPRAQVAS